MSTASASTRPGRTAEHVAQQRGTRWGYAALIAATWIACAAAAWWFLRVYLPQFRTADPAFTPSAAETPVGRWFGIAGTLLFVPLALYGVRRVAYRSRLLSMPWWYRSHLLLGIAALTLLGLHSGFAFRSPFLSLLQIAFWGSVLTGIGGWAYSRAIRGWLLRYEWRPAVWTELASTQVHLARRLEDALQPPAPKPAGGEEAPGEEPERPRVSGAPLVGSLAGLRRAHLWRFPTWEFWDTEAERAATRAEGPPGGPPPASRAPDLEEAPPNFTAIRLAVELNRVEVLRSYHRILRGWTTLHLLVVAAAVELVVWHVWVVVSY